MVKSGEPPRRVLAAVVTYNPDIELLRNLQALRSQIHTVVIVDNASDNLAFVEQAAREVDCRLIRNTNNVGIAEALNQAARLAVEEKFEWLATFDQDSLIQPGSVDGIFDVYLKHPDIQRISIVAMGQRERATGKDYYLPGEILFETEEWRSVRTVITSGSFLLMKAFRDVGEFDSRLFIDFVDHEFCQRCRKKGYLIIEARKHIMHHSIGNSTNKRVLGRTIVFTNHSPTRRYYMTRNQAEIYRRYLFLDPAWALQGLIRLLISSVLVIAYEAEKIDKFRAIMQGYRDFVLRRFGQRCEILRHNRS